jgi:tetratricopeptide (TPR) repeat protein
VREIGRQLGVGSILEGSVRRSGDMLRVSAQLIDAARGFHVWCEQYERPLQDIFVLQDEISRAVLSALKVELLAPAGTAAVRLPTRNMEAYLLYLQGRWFWHQRFAGQLKRAMECFEQAIQSDRAFALAHCGLADSFAVLGAWAFWPPGEAFPRAKALLREALLIDPSLADAHATMGLLHQFSDWDWAAAERELARAIELNPGSALTRLWAGHFLSIVGRFEEAVAEVTHAKTLDPLSPVVMANVGWTLYLARRHERALEELGQADAGFPGNPMIQLYLGFVKTALGRLPDALAHFQNAAASPGGMPWASESAGLVYGLMGDHASARRVLEASLARMGQAYVPSSAIAAIFLGTGDDDRFFEWLERCVNERDVLLPWLATMPAFDRVRPDPRFQKTLAQIGLA